MNCPKADELLEFLDNALMPAKQRRAMSRHFEQCETCQKSLTEARKLEAQLLSEELWDPRPASKHLDERDMLFALAKAGGGVHLEECQSCHNEAAIIEETVREFDKVGFQSVSNSLKNRLLNIGTKEDSELRDTTAVILGPRPAQPKARRRRTSTRSITRPTPKTPSDRQSRRTTTSRRIPSRRRASGTFRKRSGASTLPYASVLSGLAAAALLLMLVLFANSGPKASHKPTPVALETPKRPLVSDTEPKTDPTPEPKVEPKPEPKLDPLPDPILDPKPSPEPTPGPDPLPNPDKGPSTTVDPEPKPEPKVEPKPTPKLDPKADPKAPIDPDEAFARREVNDDGGQLAIAMNRVVGRVAIKRRGETKWQAVKRGRELLEISPGDTLSARGGPAFLTLSSGTELDLCLADKTEIRIEGAKDGPVIGLGRGKVLCDFERRFNPQVFILRTPHTELTSGGSSFSAEVAKGQTLASVYEGNVFCSDATNPNHVLDVGRATALKFEKSPEDLGSARSNRWGRGVLPRREVVFAANFNSRHTHKFTGTISKLDKGGALRLAPITDNKYYGQCSKLMEGRFRAFRVTEDMFIRFSYRFKKDTSKLLIEFNNQNQNKMFRKDLGFSQGGAWTRVTLNLMEDLSTYFSPGRNPMKRLDLFNHIAFYAGDPGDKTEVLIDDIEVFRKVYR